MLHEGNTDLYIEYQQIRPCSFEYLKHQMSLDLLGEAHTTT